MSILTQFYLFPKATLRESESEVVKAVEEMQSENERLRAMVTQPAQVPEGFCLDTAHRRHKKMTGESCTCPKYIRHPQCDRHEHRSYLPECNPWLASAPQPDSRDAEDAEDAARWRCLRDQIQKHNGLTIAKVGTWDLTPWSGDNPDAAIDAVMKGE